MADHFHEEWSFRVEFYKKGQFLRESRFVRLATGMPAFRTEAEARKGMDEVAKNASASIQKHPEAYDAYTVYGPQRRIVTEWEEVGR